MSAAGSHLNSPVRDVATFLCYRPPFPSVAVVSSTGCIVEKLPFLGVSVVCGVAVQSPCELAAGVSCMQY